MRFSKRLPLPAALALVTLACAGPVATARASSTSTLSLACGTISGSHNAGGKVGVPYSASLAASGGTPAYSFVVVSGGLPPGVMFNPSTGTFYGTSTVPGTYPVGAAVFDSTGAMATASCTLYFAPAPKKGH